MDFDITINYSSIARPIPEQLAKLNLKFNRTIVERFQLDKETIIRLRRRGYLSDATIDKLFIALNKNIISHLIDCYDGRIKAN